MRRAALHLRRLSGAPILPPNPLISIASHQQPRPKGIPNQDLVVAATASTIIPFTVLMEKMKRAAADFQNSGATMAAIVLSKSGISVATYGDPLAILAIKDQEGNVQTAQLGGRRGLENKTTRQMCEELGLQIVVSGPHYREKISGTNTVCFGHGGIYDKIPPTIGHITYSDLQRLAALCGLREVVQLLLVTSSDGLLAPPDLSLNSDVGFDASQSVMNRSSHLLIEFDRETKKPNSLATNKAAGTPLITEITENAAKTLVEKAVENGNGDDCSAVSLLTTQNPPTENVVLLAIDGNGPKGHEVAQNIFEIASRILGLTNIRAAGVVNIAGSEVSKATTTQGLAKEKQRF